MPRGFLPSNSHFLTASTEEPIEFTQRRETVFSIIYVEYLSCVLVPYRRSLQWIARASSILTCCPSQSRDVWNPIEGR